MLEAGSYLFPTHVYNLSRFDNADVARSFGCRNFWQRGNDSSEHYIHESPQLNLGGRSIFWSGLIPTAQDWELNFFPERVRAALSPEALKAAGGHMNESISLGSLAQKLVTRLQDGPLGADFIVNETPRALHQPYLTSAGTLRDQLFIEPTGVFNTAELLINQLGRTRDDNANGLHLLLSQYVEDIQSKSGRYEIISRTTGDGSARHFQAPQVVLCAGSIESPKLLARSTLGRTLSRSVQNLIGRGLTDHPTTSERSAAVTHCGPIPITKSDHAKIILYSRGRAESGAPSTIRFPFNVEVNINHEYWHRRENDPNEGIVDPGLSSSRVDLKFSFANCLDGQNSVHPAPPFQYVPEIQFKNLNWTSHTAARLSALAGWRKSDEQIFALLNQVAGRVFSEFSNGGNATQPDAPLGQQGKGFGRGTVHHAVGTLRMPHRPSLTAPIDHDSVVDEDLQLRGAPGVSVCDMSVMPISTAANPVRSLAALALRLSSHLAGP